MPNRMFDPVSNPFAIQNLLERECERPTFVGLPDERDAAGFGPDPFASGKMVRAFEVDSTLHGGDDEVTAGQASASDFSAPPGQPQPRFSPDLEAGHDDTPTAQASAAAATATTATTARTVTPPARASQPASPAAAKQPKAAAAIAAEDQAAPSALPAAGRTAAPAAPSEIAAAPAGLDHATVEKMMEEARADAYARGREEGRQEGLQQGLEQGRQQGVQQGRDEERPRAHREGYDEGHAAGLAQAQAGQQDAMQQLQQQQIAQLQAVIDGLRELMYDADALFEPMKKLTVHLAEQLVRGELSQSPQAISRLVDNALHELNASGDKPVLVHLHPEDLELYRPTVAQFADSLHLRPDSTLERGSVRASLDGSVVEDLILRRVEGLKKSLAQPPAPGWRSGAGRLAARTPQAQPVQDATPVEHADHAVPETEAAPAEGHA